MLENGCEFSTCFETNLLSQWYISSVITNSLLYSDKVCFALLSSVYNLNQLDSLKYAGGILLKDMKFKSGFDSRYALSGGF